jgi:hypothetical protein
MIRKFFLFFLSLSAFYSGLGQKSNLVYVDNKGVLRYTKDKSEASFFGVNYTVPFAYGYRSHKALGVDIEKAIDADVHHMARLGLDAFRVHVWDVEITDSTGRLLENEHLRLFDYLLSKLKEKNIRVLITPIAFWGNGYPEQDSKTNGFSYVYTKGGSVVKEEAFKAQENYLRQFFTHVNPYTKLSYKDDPDVIAMEINNEPHHSGPKERTTEYVNRMAAAVKSTGWTKPIFYNISESPSYADAVVKANVDGHSFQWYPTGLVANHERKGNFLPNVDQYYIPFSDTIPAFKNRAKMVYEFDAGDVMQPVMYPAMARSYRTAGFQWATQFAYDPMFTAYGNTEYQTHYLNLAYTPAKAISLLIASEVFHRLPRGKSYGTYPADTLFDVFRVSYKEQLSEMNSDEKFYYTSSTTTQPRNIAKLKYIAGVGNSSLVKYEGTGAYFLDKVSDGVWRLEVMPDVIVVKDPFEKASPKKSVTLIQWQKQAMQINLPALGTAFNVKGISFGHEQGDRAGNGVFMVSPGVYLITGKAYSESKEQVGFRQQEYYAPEASSWQVSVTHQPVEIISPGKPYNIIAKVTGINNPGQVSVEVRNSSNKWKTVPMQRREGYGFKAEVPADMVTPGVINYRIMVKANNDTYTFPGGFKGNPYAWDEYRNESWQTYIAAPNSSLELFNPATDRTRIMLYNQDWRNNTMEYITTGKPNQLALRATMNKPTGKQFMGWQYYFTDKIQGRRDELSSFTKLVVRARAQQNTTANVSLITTGADAYAVTLPLTTEWRDIEIPLSSLQKSSFLLLPRPYPGFLPLRFTSAGTTPLKMQDAERVEITFGEGATSPVSIELESIRLEK